MVKGSLAAVQGKHPPSLASTYTPDALENLQSLLHLLPTGPHTLIAQRTSLITAINTLRNAVDNYPKRSRLKRKHGEDEPQEHPADWMDQQGTDLWNRADFARQNGEANKEHADLVILSQIQEASYKLLNKATDAAATGLYLYRLLFLSSKVTAALIEAEDFDRARQLVEQAAEPRTLDAPDNESPLEKPDRLGALAEYYLARFDMAMVDNNEVVAFSMAQYAAEVDPSRVPGARHIMNVSSKLMNGAEILRGHRGKGEEGLKWLRYGLDVLDKTDEMKPVLQLDDLKVALLRANIGAEQSSDRHSGPGTLGRLNMLTGRLISLADAMCPGDNLEIKTIRLQILIDQNASEDEIGEAIAGVVDATVWTAKGVADVLGAIGSPKVPKDLRCFYRHNLLERAVSNQENSVFALGILISILIGVRMGDCDDQTGRQLVAQAMNRMGVGYEDAGGIISCQTVIWSFGDRASKAGHHDQAAGWFQLGAHDALIQGGRGNFSKFNRKAVMSYINGGDLVNAHLLINKCPPKEASTQYLKFLVAVLEGREESAISAIKAILNCPDLRGEYLLIMAQEAEKKGLRRVLKCAIGSLFSEMISEVATSIKVHGIVLVRALVQMTLSELRMVTTVEMVEYLYKRNEAQEHVKAIVWLYKTAYNAGVEGSASWTPAQLSTVFDLASRLMALYISVCHLDRDPELPMQHATAVFACFCGKAFTYRDLDEGPEKAHLLVNLLNYCPKIVDVVGKVEPDGGAAEEKRKRILWTMALLETELLCEQGDWAALEERYEQTILANDSEQYTADRAMGAVITVLAQYPECPTSFTCRVLQHVLSRLTPREPEEIDRAARWTRSLVLSLLHRGAPEDADKARGFIDRAGELAHEWPEVYPSDDVAYLVSIAWDRGLSEFGWGNAEQGHKWCGTAMKMAAGVQSLARQHAMMSDYYPKLVQRRGAV